MCLSGSVSLRLVLPGCGSLPRLSLREEQDQGHADEQAQFRDPERRLEREDVRNPAQCRIYRSKRARRIRDWLRNPRQARSVGDETW